MISVIVPCYRVERFLREAIESVLTQTYHHWELILVDDGSPDTSLAIAEQFLPRDRRIRIFSRPNGGVAAARNTGFNASTITSGFIVFLDPDDILLPTALEEMSGHLEKHPEAGAVVCEIQDIDASGRPFGKRRKNRWTRGWLFPRKMRPTETVTSFLAFFCGSGQGPHVMYRRAAFEATGGWDESFRRQQDTDLFTHLALLYPIHFLDRRLYLYRHWKGQAVNNADEIGHYNEKFREKWDLIEGETPEQRLLLSQARSYFWHFFYPCHQLKGVLCCLPGFIRRPNSGTAGWLVKLLGNAFKCALLGSPYLAARPPGTVVAPVPAVAAPKTSGS